MQSYPLSDPNNPQPQPGDSTQSAQPSAPVQNTPAPSTTPSATSGATNPTPAAATPAPTSPQTPAQQPPSQSAQPSQNGSQAGTVSNAPAPVHPSIQKASTLRAVAETLAGGPRYSVSIDPQTGAATRTRVPLSSRDIGMAIALEAISGSLAGLSQRGPGATGRAAEAGFQQVQQQQQAADIQREQQAQQNFENQSNQLARRASIYETNSRSVLNVSQAEAMGAEAIDKLVDINRQSGVLDVDPSTLDNGGQPMTQQEISDAMKNGKLSPTDQLGPVAGRVEVTNPDGSKRWEATHLVILDPNQKVTLSQSDWDRYADSGVPGFPKGTKIGAGVEIPLRMKQNANEIMASHYLAGQRLDDLRNVLDGTQYAKDVPASIDFSKPGINTAMQRFQRYVSHDAANLEDPFLALQQMGAAKRNPQSGQMEPNPDAKYVDTVAAAFGGWPILEAAHGQLAANKKAAADYAVIDTSDKANAVLAAPKRFTSDQVQAARSFLNLSTQQKATAAGAEARARKTAEDFGTGNSAQLAAEQPVNGVRQNYLASLPADQQEMVRSIGEGRIDPAARLLYRKDGQQIMQEVTTAYPGYDFSRAPEYAATRKDFTSGKTSQAINALNTAMGHMLTMYNNATLGGSLPIVGGIERAAGNQTAINLANSKAALVDELGKAYKAGALTDQDVKIWKGRINAWTPAEIKGNAQSFVQLLDSKLSSYEQQWKNGAPPGAVAPIQILSPEARDAYQTITGRQPITGSQQMLSRGPVPPPGATMQVPGSDGKLHWSDGKRDLGVIQQ